jgi:hypothetical protein
MKMNKDIQIIYFFHYFDWEFVIAVFSAEEIFPVEIEPQDTRL